MRIKGLGGVATRRVCCYTHQIYSQAPGRAVLVLVVEKLTLLSTVTHLK